MIGKALWITKSIKSFTLPRRFLYWLVAGLILYFFYGYRRSRLAPSGRPRKTPA